MYVCKSKFQGGSIAQFDLDQEHVAPYGVLSLLTELQIACSM